jgi:hypothetical protein
MEEEGASRWVVPCLTVDQREREVLKACEGQLDKGSKPRTHACRIDADGLTCHFNARWGEQAAMGSLEQLLRTISYRKCNEHVSMLKVQSSIIAVHITPWSQ